MKRTVFSLLAAFALCVSAAAAGPAVSCPSALLMEKQTGTVLFAQDEHTPREPASVTKIMTLLLVMEAIDSGALSYDDVVTGSAHAAGMGGSQIWLKENEQMTVRDLLAAGHLTSVCDIALMSRELILHHPDIRQFTTVWMDSLRGGESMLVNTNKLIRFYDGATGLKTGSTGSAGYCLSATAEKNGMELIAVVLKSKTSDERFSDAKSLLNYGFSTWSLVTVTPDEVLPPVPVTLGVRGTVQPVLTSENTLLVEKTLANGLTKEVALAESVAAPVYAGDTLGQLTVRDAAGNTVAELPILAGEDVGHVTFVQMLGRCLARGFCMGPQS